MKCVKVRTANDESIGYLVCNDKTGVTIASTYNVQLKIYPVTVFIPRKDIVRVQLISCHTADDLRL